MRSIGFPYAALIVGAMLTFAACNPMKYFQSSQAPDDNAITSDIQAKLYQDPTLKTENIHVLSQKGVVLLSGTVSSDTEKSQAEQLANGVSGVKQVIDQISVVPSATASAAPAAAPETTAAPENPMRPRPLARRARRQSSQESQQAEISAPPQPAPAAQNNAPQPAPAQVTPAPPPPPQPIQVAVPAGTVITIRTIDTVDSSRNHEGDKISATVDAPVTVGDQVVIPRNSDAVLQVVQVASAGHIKGQSEVKLQLVSVSVQGNPYSVESGYYDKLGASRGKRSAETIGGGAGLGALIGAIAGHGKGAAIGAAIGAGAGTAAQEATKAQQVVIPSETKLDFTLRNPLTVSLNP